MDKTVLSTLGLARRAGKAIMGLESVEKYRKPISLLIVASDASPRVMRSLTQRTDPILTPEFTKSQLGRAVGCKEAAVVGVLDAGFAGILRKKLELQEELE